MARRTNILMAAGFALAAAAAGEGAAAADLEVRIEGLRSAEGDVRVALHRQAAGVEFPGDGGMVDAAFGKAAPGALTFVFAGLAPRFLDRLPPELGRDLVYLKMADHYVEAFTAAGSTLILMRFADAIAELDGLDGLRVHRSYWVARRHVAGTARRAGRTTLRLTGGHLVPVSRGRLAEVRAAGLA